MNQKTPDPSEEIKADYDFSGATRGKHHIAYGDGTNMVMLDTDVAEVFKDSASVNEALRLLLRLAKQQSQTSRSA